MESYYDVLLKCTKLDFVQNWSGVTVTAALFRPIYTINSEWTSEGVSSDTGTHIHRLTHQLAGFGAAAQWAPGLGIPVCGSAFSGSVALSIPACSTSASEAWEEWLAVCQRCTRPGTVCCISRIQKILKVLSPKWYKTGCTVLK